MKEKNKYEVGLKKTRGLFAKIKQLFSKSIVDEQYIIELEEILIMADIPVSLTLRFVDEFKNNSKKLKSTKDLKSYIITGMKKLYKQIDAKLNENIDGATIYLFVGVNGSGKTTSIAKLAHKLKSNDKRVLLVAGDTFRAGAKEQLNVWAKKLAVDIEQKDTHDPASVVFDALKKRDEYDYILIDTAGRLHSKQNLMKELEKVKSIIKREVVSAPHEVFLIVDATTGQNGLEQAKKFIESAEVSSLILTKLDGTAKGGIVLAINDMYDLPIHFIGVGETLDDLVEFDIDKYLEGLLDGF